MMSKTARFTAMAVKYYIAMLAAAREHSTEPSDFDNDIAMLACVLPILDRGEWPENRTVEMGEDPAQVDAPCFTKLEIAKLKELASTIYPDAKL